MKLKKTIYPKTKRIGKKIGNVEITEKIDGSNLTFYKLNGELYVAQRNWVFSLEEAISSSSKMIYKGLHSWLVENGNNLCDELLESSAICGEWIAQGHIKYNEDKKFVQFAKANVNKDIELYNVYYYQDLFKWSFKSKEQPGYIDSVPILYKLGFIPSVSDLDDLYDEYTQHIDRKVEGFIINSDNNITKYVRMKNGKPSMHKTEITKG